MNFIQLLLADLDRQFILEGKTGKKASVLALLKRLLHPRLLPLILCRLSRATYLWRVPVLPFVFSYLNLVLFGLQVTPKCEIGPGLFLPHTHGTVIGAWRLGKNATIFQGVTLGAKEVDFTFSPEMIPELCDGVTVGAGAIILGGITIGSNVTVGANSVVLKSIEPNSTVAGIPARTIHLHVRSH